MNYRPGSDAGLGALSPEGASDGGKKKSKPRSKTTLKAVNRQLLFAGLFAIVVVAGALLFLNRPEPGTYVVRATTDIAALETLTPNLFEAVKVPDEDVVPTAFQGATKEEAQAAGIAALESSPRSTSIINKNQQLTPSIISGVAGMTAPLEDGERIISVSADVVSGVAGQIKSGDSIDIFATAETDGGESVTGLLASNVPVLSVTVSEALYQQAQNVQQKADESGRNTGSLIPTDPIAPGIYVLRVSDEVAPRIIASQVNGKLFFAYRGAESADISTPPLTALEALCAANPEAGNTPACQGVEVADPFVN